MKILALETSTPAGSLAIADGETILGELFINISVSHSRRLLPALEWLLSELGLKIQDMDGFALAIGPGSFTGLRIGLSTVKGLAMATDKPVVGVSSLEALARNVVETERIICPMIDARKREVYSALYRREGPGGLVCIQPDRAVKPREMADACKEETVFLGNGAVFYRSLIEECLGSRAYFPPSHLIFSRAASVASLALNRFLKADVDNLSTLVPRYLRPSEAELKTSGRRSF